MVEDGTQERHGNVFIHLFNTTYSSKGNVDALLKPFNGFAKIFNSTLIDFKASFVKDNI